MTPEELQQQADKLEAELKPIKAALNEIHSREAAAVETKIETCYQALDSFEENELRYSREAKCKCGSGIAYPLKIGMNGAWHCAAILTGTADAKVEHTGPLPFMYYEIKSETEKQSTRNEKK